MKRLTLSLMAFTAIACTGVANASGGCPTGTDLELTVKAVGSEKSCQKSAELARSCMWGSNADIQIVGAAMEVCARDYTNLSVQDSVTYTSVLKMCDRKYESESGSLYNAMRAHCRLNVAELFSKLYTPVR